MDRTAPAMRGLICCRGATGTKFQSDLSPCKAMRCSAPSRLISTWRQTWCRPWSGLLVGRGQRGKGVATALLQCAESLAEQLGFEQLYISTEFLGGLLVRRGWRPIGAVEFLNRAHGSIYVRAL